MSPRRTCSDMLTVLSTFLDCCVNIPADTSMGSFLMMWSKSFKCGTERVYVAKM